MKTTIALLLFILSSFSFSFAQEEVKENTEENHHPEWSKSISEAIVNNANVKNPLFILFTGKDWCPSCKVLEETVLSKEEFKTYMKGNYELVYLDYPNDKSKRTEKNAQYQQMYQVSKFPTIIITSHDGVPFISADLNFAELKDFIKYLGEVKERVKAIPAITAIKDEKEAIKKSIEFVKGRLDGENMSMYAEIFYKGVLFNEEISVTQKVDEIAGMFIFPANDALTEMVIKQLNVLSPNGKHGVKELLKRKEFVDAIRQHDDAKAYEVFKEHPTSFAGEYVGLIYEYAGHIASHGHYDRSIELVTFVINSEHLKQYPETIEKMKEQIEQLKNLKNNASGENQVEEEKAPASPEQTEEPKK